MGKNIYRSPATPVEPGKGRQPRITIPGDIDTPMAEVSQAAGGIKIYTLDCSPQEVIRVSFVFRAGTSEQEKPFSASAAANLLSEGTANLTAQQIAETLDFYGAHFDASIDRDYSVVTLVSLSKYFRRTMELTREILLAPVFPQEEVEIYRAKRKQRLAMERAKVGFRGRELFTQTLFGADHPYGVSYHEDLYDSLSRESIEELFRRKYTAENCFIVCSGMVKGAEREIIEALAADIPGKRRSPERSFPSPRPGRFAFAEQPDAVQSAVCLGRLLFPRNHPDYVAMQVASTILGGYFGSRLVRNLREERGYTYGVFATMANLEHAGYFAVATEVATEATPDAARQTLAEIERLREKTVPKRELDMVRNIMTGEVMRILDGPFGIADVTIENIQNGADNGYLERLLDEIRTITPGRVREVARKYLDPADFTCAVAGDGRIASETEKAFGL